MVLVAGFSEPIGYDEIKSFLDAPVEFEKIKTHTNKFSAIHSDNDPYVPLEQGETFKQKLNAELTVLEGMKHFSGKEGITELPQALDAILKFAK